MKSTIFDGQTDKLRVRLAKLQATQIKQFVAGHRVDIQIQVAALDIVTMQSLTKHARVRHAITGCGLAYGIAVLAECFGRSHGA